MLKKNQELLLSIDGMSAEGTGIGRFEGQAVFVSGTAIGDSVSCRIIKAKKNYAVGKIIEIAEPSSDRIPSDCPVSDRCGGCCFRHASYPAELQYKQKKVEDALQRIGHISCPVHPVLESPVTEHYRNKAQYPVCKNPSTGAPEIGFYAFHSHRIIPCTDCRLQPVLFSKLLSVICGWAERFSVPAYDEATGKGLLRHIYLRQGQISGEVMVCLVVTRPAVPHTEELVKALRQFSEVKTILLNINKERTNVILGQETCLLFGDGYIKDQLLGKTFFLSPRAFYQVNHDGCELLYRKAAEYAALSKEDILLDLYCGVGTIGLTMADKCKQVYGVEIIPEAVEDAKRNAKENGIQNATFFCGDAAAAAEKLRKEQVHADVIIVDPPRKGLSPNLIQTVTTFSPKRIVYVSCDPATLARDLALFKEQGYLVSEATPVDLFPRTAHVETVALLLKGKEE